MHLDQNIGASTYPTEGRRKVLAESLHQGRDGVLWFTYRHDDRKAARMEERPKGFARMMCLENESSLTCGYAGYRLVSIIGVKGRKNA